MTFRKHLSSSVGSATVLLRCPFGRIPKRPMSVRCRAFEANSDFLAAASVATTLRLYRVRKGWWEC